MAGPAAMEELCQVVKTAKCWVELTVGELQVREQGSQRIEWREFDRLRVVDRGGNELVSTRAHGLSLAVAAGYCLDQLRRVGT